MNEGDGQVIRILVVDDHQVVRRGLSAYLGMEEDMEVVAEAADGEEAIIKYSSLRPDLVLLDLHMQPVGGLAALRAIRKQDAHARVLVLTSFVDPEHVLPAIEEGACGYLLKTAEPHEIVDAIRQAIMGRSTFDPDALQVMADGLRHKATVSELTEREQDVLRLIAQGKSNQEIADGLFIGVKTVKTHVSNILAKLDVADRTQAAVYAIRHGLA